MPTALPSTYPEALDWLYAQTRSGRPRDPARARVLLAALRLPMPDGAVHVVGTNGKGTVAAMMAEAYRAGGIPAGRFLSPHVESFRERIEVAGEPIPEHEVVAFVRAAAALRLEPRPAFFELTFAMALWHFARAGVRLAIVEAGVGARRDATILLENVRVVVLTQIARDHPDALGSSLQEVVEDKAEAIRPAVPVVTGATGAVLERIAAVASRRHSPLFLDLPSSALFAPPPAVGEEGDPVRRGNARLAAAALRVLGDLPEEAIQAGLRAPPLPARRERFPIGERCVLLDGAHDPSAAQALADSLPGPYGLVFGCLPRKKGEETLAALERGATRVWVTRVDGAAPTVARTPSRVVVDDPREALALALAACPPGGLVVVAGSLHLAGELRPRLRALAAG